MLRAGNTAELTVFLSLLLARQDVFAMLLAAHHPGIELLGISTVFGNASLE